MDVLTKAFDYKSLQSEKEKLEEKSRTVEAQNQWLRQRNGLLGEDQARLQEEIAALKAEIELLEKLYEKHHAISSQGRLLVQTRRSTHSVLCVINPSSLSIKIKSRQVIMVPDTVMPYHHKRYGLYLFFKVLPYFFVVVYDHGHLAALLQFTASAAGLKSLSHCALADRTYGTAICKLYSIGAASHAVDSLRGDLVCMIHLAPFACSLFSKVVIIVYCGYSGIAFLTVQPTVCNQFFHFISPSAAKISIRSCYYYITALNNLTS